MNPREINIQIEELVLHGLPTDARHQIGTVVETELSRLLQKNGLPDAWRSNANRLDAGVIRATPLTSPATTGARIADVVYHVLNPKQTTTNQKANTS